MAINQDRHLRLHPLECRAFAVAHGPHGAGYRRKVLRQTILLDLVAPLPRALPVEELRPLRAS